MRYQRTQVYLDPDDHRALLREAAELGISLAELIRRLVSGHVSESAMPYAQKSVEALIGSALDPDAPESDVAVSEDRYKAEAFERLQPTRARKR